MKGGKTKSRESNALLKPQSFRQSMVSKRSCMIMVSKGTTYAPRWLLVDISVILFFFFFLPLPFDGPDAEDP